MYIDIGLNSMSVGDCAQPYNGKHVSENMKVYRKNKKSLVLHSKMTIIIDYHYHHHHHHWLPSLPLDLPSLSSILLDNGACMEFSSVNLTYLPQLTDLILGNDETSYNSFSFSCAKACTISNLPTLQTLELGSHAFNAAKELVLSNLPSLISLSIGNNSFKKMLSFELTGLTNLASISIGDNCMCGAQQFVLRGMDIKNQIARRVIL